MSPAWFAASPSSPRLALPAYSLTAAGIMCLRQIRECTWFGTEQQPQDFVRRFALPIRIFERLFPRGTLVISAKASCC